MRDLCNLIVGRVLRWLLMVPILAAFASGVFAQPVKISGGMVTGGDVTSYQYSPNGEFVVFLADKDTDGRDELYSVRLSSGVITKLSGALTTGRDVKDSFQISPDGTRVVFLADKDTDEVFELYSVPIGFGTPTKLSGALVTGGNVSFFNISPDGAGVVFTADKDTDNVPELYSVPITGGTTTKLSGTLVTGGAVAELVEPLETAGASVILFEVASITHGVERLRDARAAGLGNAASGVLLAASGGSVRGYPDAAAAPDEWARGALELDAARARVIGGGAGTTEAHTAALARELGALHPSIPAPRSTRR